MREFDGAEREESEIIDFTVDRTVVILEQTDRGCDGLGKAIDMTRSRHQKIGRFRSGCRIGCLIQYREIDGAGTDRIVLHEYSVTARIAPDGLGLRDRCGKIDATAGQSTGLGRR